MTKYEMIKEIGLNDYYGEKQAEATKRMMKQTKGTLALAVLAWKKTPNAQTREFIGRVLTGIFKNNCSINEIK